MPKSAEGNRAANSVTPKTSCFLVTIVILALIASACSDDQFVFKLLEAGAAGYLLKSVRGREVVDAVRAVAAGESVLHPQIESWG